jgi:hypothetical protein
MSVHMNDLPGPFYAKSRVRWKCLTQRQRRPPKDTLKGEHDRAIQEWL